MPRDYFQFKKFSIYQNRCAMKVGTDGVLLGAWAKVVEDKNILDIGTGTGLVALMLAQRSNATIEAIEIDEGAANQAKENFERSDWAGRIGIQQISFQKYVMQKNVLFDHIVCNPPFFKNSMESQKIKRTIARHATELSIEELLNGSATLLKEGGKLSLIFPAIDFEDNLKLADQIGLGLVRQTMVTPHAEKNSNRVLAEFSKSYNGKCHNNTLILYGDKQQNRSAEYTILARDFYLDR